MYFIEEGGEKNVSIDLVLHDRWIHCRRLDVRHRNGE